MRFVVLFDACVLYPAPLRDFLLRLATTGLFAAKWTDQIHEEWTGKLLSARPELKEQLARTRQLMDQAIPDCLVTSHESLISGLTLPDADDRHVLAAAIRASAQMIVTFNLKDFPNETLKPYGIEALHPDVFVECQFELQKGLVIAAAKRHRAARLEKACQITRGISGNACRSRPGGYRRPVARIQRADLGAWAVENAVFNVDVFSSSSGHNSEQE